MGTGILKLQSFCKQLPFCTAENLCHKDVGNIYSLFVCLKQKVYNVLHFAVNICKM